MPAFNGRDTVKAHQDEGNGKQLDLLIRGDVRQGLSLNRPRILQEKEEEELVQVPESGKPDAGKLARPVWNGGKAERPYPSLRVIDKSRSHMGIPRTIVHRAV
jgi:hypothetical protein